MKRTLTALAAASLLLALGLSPSVEARGTAGAVYTMTNAPAPGGNEVVAFDRLANGWLRHAGMYPTGGSGTGEGLGNQGGVVLSDNGRWLLVVNAGSNEVSLFAVHRHGLSLRETVHSGGYMPVSVAIHRDLVYVVHAGSKDIAGFRIGRGGALTPVSGSHQSLSGSGPAQIGFSPDGGYLLVTEKATNEIDVFPVYRDGSVGVGVPYPAAGETPFAFDFGKRDQLFVSEVFGGATDTGAVSSYELTRDGVLEIIDDSVPNFETAPCWLVVTRGGRYVFTTNTPDDSLSAYAIDFAGHLNLLDGQAGKPGMGTRPLDMDLSDDGRFLYTLDIGTDTISIFRVTPKGSLKLLGSVPGVPGANGLVAR